VIEHVRSGVSECQKRAVNEEVVMSEGMDRLFETCILLK